MDFLILLLLTVINGVLAMSELAILSARRARLQQKAEEGSKSAKIALELTNNPNRFLSTVQIGITLIGILAGVFGGATVAGDIALQLAKIDFLRPYADALGFVFVVLLTTYLSLVVGELVPKRLAIQNPERIAMLVAPSMHYLSLLTYPLVWLLSLSTEAILKLLGIKDDGQSAVTEEEIHVMLREGAESGVFHKSEQDMIAGVFRLGDLKAEALMTPRTGMFWFEITDTPDKILEKVEQSDYSRFPVCEGGLDHVIGIISAKDLLRQALSGQPIDLRANLLSAQFIPETAAAGDVLEVLRGHESQLALVIGEYGNVEGVITINDILEAIVGALDDEPEAVQRADGSWLVDGLISVEEFKDLVDLKDELPGEDEKLFQTLAGFIMTHQGKVPVVADTFEWQSFRFEVVDMDGRRVDKVLVQRIAPVTDSKLATGETKPINEDATQT